MNEILTRQEVCQMLPFYVLGTLESDKMLACQSYLQNRADRTLLLQYQHVEETAINVAFSLPQQPLPAWVKEQLMARVRTDRNLTSQSWRIRGRRRRVSNYPVKNWYFHPSLRRKTDF